MRGLGRGRQCDASQRTCHADVLQDVAESGGYDDFTGHDFQTAEDMPRIRHYPRASSGPDGGAGVVSFRLQRKGCPALAQRHPETALSVATLQAVAAVADCKSGPDCGDYPGVSGRISLLEGGADQNGGFAHRSGADMPLGRRSGSDETTVRRKENRVFAGKTGSLQGIQVFGGSGPLPGR